MPLKASFYERDTLLVARDLLGKRIVRKLGRKLVKAEIVETEAYIGSHDPAAHSFGKITDRNRIMFGKAGLAYVYFIYGNYYCLNTVTGKVGEGNAVLIRACEIVEGIESAAELRGGMKHPRDLANGPGKLCISLNINKKLNGHDLTKHGELYIERGRDISTSEIVHSTRIGITKGTDLKYRFFIRDNEFVSKHKISPDKAK